MATATTTMRAHRASVLSHPADAALVAIAITHATLVASVVALDPRGVHAIVVAALLGLATVYSSNTVSHWHIHRPLFASCAASRALSLLITATSLVPQTAWKQRHLWHHRGEAGPSPRHPLRGRLLTELAVVCAAVSLLAWLRPYTLAFVVAPGFALGMSLARMQGHFEHEGDDDRAKSGVSHYGWLYNALWFNDGYHAEHHRSPGTHWAELVHVRRDPPRTSAHAPLLRLLDRLDFAAWSRASALGLLERAVPRFPRLERWVVQRHARAIASLLEGRPTPRRIAIVGGGLFPRTVLVMREVAENASVVVIDASSESLEVARRHLDERGIPHPAMQHARFDSEVHRGFDLVVFPLAFVGARESIARACEHNTLVLTHDWLTTRLPHSRVVSGWLWKRVNLHEASS